MLRAIGRSLLSHRDIAKLSVCRSISHYPIDETIFGLTEDQIQVNNWYNMNGDLIQGFTNVPLKSNNGLFARKRSKIKVF